MSKVELIEKARAESMEDIRKVTDRMVAIVNAPKPTKAELAELRKALKDAPEWIGVFGDVSMQLRYKIIESLARQPGLRVVMEKQVENMAEELGTKQASPLERLLIDQVIIAWLRWQSVEWAYQNGFEEGPTLTKALYLEKRLSAAHRRYLQAIESLAKVRRLLARVGVQVNIAQQQVVRNG